MAARRWLYAAASSRNPLKNGSHIRRSTLCESSSRLAAYVQTRNALLEGDCRRTELTGSAQLPLY
jgi:hypothetical protein